jgi:hypothetical protein
MVLPLAVFVICFVRQVACQAEDGEELSRSGYLKGYNGYVIAVIAFQAITGLVGI